MIDRRHLLAGTPGLAGAALAGFRVDRALANHGAFVLTAKGVDRSIVAGQLPDSGLWLHNGQSPGLESGCSTATCWNMPQPE